MTIETNNPAEQSPGDVSITRKSRSEVIKTIQEITPFDEMTITRAIEACLDSDGRYSIDQVLNVLMDDKYPSDYQDNPSSKNSYNNSSYNSSSQRTNTSNEDSSNKQRGKFNLNVASKPVNVDSDYSNIADDDDINNESDLIRDSDKPCGLKNIGNTCWFNSIIQAFFHLPYFRKLVLSYQITSNALEKLDDNSKNVVQFVFELRKLFALLLRSKRKAINPANTLRILRNCSKFNVNHFNQEDVSEFSTILVNLIEESFDILSRAEQQQQQQQLNINIQQLQIQKIHPQQQQQSNLSITTSSDTIESAQIHGSNENATIINQIPSINLNTSPLSRTNDETNRERKNRKNPIVNLLNGDIMICRKNIDDDAWHCITEIFREVNIQMLNSRNLYDGLELEWGETSINAASNSSKSLVQSIYEQESWIMKPPSVLFICLNRYKFVKATQSSSKIVEPFEFYPNIYLDRYMYANKECIKLKRKELKVLNNELNLFEQKLNTIKNYDCSNKSYPLDEVLKCTLNFATTDHDNHLFSQLQPRPCKSRTETELNTTCTQYATSYSDSNLNALRYCLENWIREIQSKIKDLENSIKETKEKINRIYDDENLKKLKYNLHSVCIHEGSATLGHFWTYIWNPIHHKWYKYNDIEVCESNWDDLYSNAIGGVRKDNGSSAPSAYFLIYTKANEDYLYSDANELTIDLERLVKDDQDLLQSHLNTVKIKQVYKTFLEKTKKYAAQSAASDNYQTCIEHAKAFCDYTLDAFQSSFDKILNADIDEALRNAIDHELNRFSETSKDVQNKLPDIDLRTNHILTYFSCNSVAKDIREFAILDVFRMQIFTDSDLRVKILQFQALCKHHEIINDQTKFELIKAYEKWQNDYKDFRSIIAAFITACSHMEMEKYEEAMPFFCVSCEFNERITNNLKWKLKGMDHDLLTKCRRKCLKLWNQMIIKKFTTKTKPFHQMDQSLSASATASSSSYYDTDIATLDQQNEQTRLIEIMMGKYLPCFYRLLNSTNEDRAFIEEIRQDWLSILDTNLGELQIFHDFMTKLFEEPYGNHFHQLSVNKSNLFDRYKETVHTFKTTFLKQQI